MGNWKWEIELGAVQKLFIQNAQNEFVSARRRREACRGTLTDAAKQVL